MALRRAIVTGSALLIATSFASHSFATTNNNNSTTTPSTEFNPLEFQAFLKDTKESMSRLENFAWRLPKDFPHREETLAHFYRNPCTVEGTVGSFDIKEDENAVYARVDLPGVNNEGLRLWMEKGPGLRFEAVVDSTEGLKVFLGKGSSLHFEGVEGERCDPADYGVTPPTKIRK